MALVMAWGCKDVMVKRHFYHEDAWPRKINQGTVKPKIPLIGARKLPTSPLQFLIPNPLIPVPRVCFPPLDKNLY
jgi:hypothetical protein